MGWTPRPPCPDEEDDPDGYEDWRATYACRDCDGEGEFYDAESGEDCWCPTCNGSGIEPDPDDVGPDIPLGLP